MLDADPQTLRSSMARSWACGSCASMSPHSWMRGAKTHGLTPMMPEARVALCRIESPEALLDAMNLLPR